jgi:hypothetical protein
MLVVSDATPLNVLIRIIAQVLERHQPPSES